MQRGDGAHELLGADAARDSSAAFSGKSVLAGDVRGHAEMIRVALELVGAGLLEEFDAAASISKLLFL